MPAPLVPIAVGAAARFAAKKLAGKAVKKATSKSVKKAAAAKKQAAVRAETKKIASNSVKVLPRKTAPKSGLEGRGARLTRAQRAERAQDYQFDKSLGKFYNNQDRIAGTHPSELARGSRGEGKRLARKTAAIKKEGKPVVKIDSSSTASLRKALRNLKPMEDVPKGVSARFAATNARMVREAAKKKK
jgi:hypothetical protein